MSEARRAHSVEPPIMDSKSAAGKGNRAGLSPYDLRDLTHDELVKLLDERLARLDAVTAPGWRPVGPRRAA